MKINAFGLDIERYRINNIHCYKSLGSVADMDTARVLYRMRARVFPAVLVFAVAVVLFYPRQKGVRKAVEVLSVPAECGLLVRVHYGTGKGTYYGIGKSPARPQVFVRFKPPVAV